jgi:hypothetical protein
MGENSLFNKWCWDNWISICERMELEAYFMPYAKLNSKGIKDPNVRAKVEENVRVDLDIIGLNKVSLDIPKTQVTKEKAG